MNFWQILLTDLGRIGMGLVFALSVLIDLKARRQVFQLMRQKNVPWPWLFYLGGTMWKATTGLALVVDFFTMPAALLLALYILLANLIFNNFWAVPKEQREFSLYLFMVYLATCFGLLVIAGVS